VVVTIHRAIDCLRQHNNRLYRIKTWLAHKNNKNIKEVNMALVKKDGLDYEDSKEISKPNKKGIRVISEMSTSRILWYVTCRHSSGLKTLAIIGFAGYIAYDKVIKHLV
jgi:hypothetical protein